MANDCAAVGSQTRMLLQGGNLPRTFGSSSTRLDFLYETLGTDRKLESKNHITGTRSQYQGGVREKSYIVTGTLALHPNAAQLAVLLPYILGGTASGTSYPLAEGLPSADFLIDRENGIFRYAEMYVAQAVLRGRSAQGGDEPELLELIIQWVGKSETIDGEAWPGTAPAIADGTVDLTPYTFSQGVMTIDSTARPFDAFNLMIDNRLMVRTRNNIAPTCIRATDRIIRLQTANPFLTTTLGNASNLWGVPYTGTLVFTNGSVSTTFSFAALRNAFKTPTAKNKGEIPLELNLEAYRTASTAEIVVTHDSTP